MSWDKLYRAGMQQARWPWSDLISIFHSLEFLDCARLRVLELGCGVGANIPFFLDLGAEYHGTDSSAVAVDSVVGAFPQLANNIAVSNFVQGVAFENQFDLIFDRFAISFNHHEDIASCLKHHASKLSQAGFIVGIDWPSDEHPEALIGSWSDSVTRVPRRPGPFDHSEFISFYSALSLELLLNSLNLDLIYFEKKSIGVIKGSSARDGDFFNFVACLSKRD